MGLKSFYEKPQSELLVVNTEWDFLLSAVNSEDFTEEKGSWTLDGEEE